MLAPITHILPQTIIRRLRLLPREGLISVRQGQTVRATDVVGKANLKPRHYMLDVAAGLGVPRGAAAKHLERFEEDVVEEGDVIARKPGLLSRVVRAPVAGKIVLMTDDFIMLEEAREAFNLLAGLPGVVTELVHEMGAVIETSGALVQGYWGNGRIDFGVLNVLVDSPDGELKPEMIDVSLRGAVLMAGRCSEQESFRRAAEQRLRGLVLGSMPSELIPMARKLPFPVLLTDGFGDRPMNPAAFKLLSTSDKRDIAVNAEPANPETGARPEAVIPAQGAAGAESGVPAAKLEVGQRVRLVRAPHLGAMGVLEALPPGRTLFSNGLRLEAASIRLDDGQAVLFPVANLEIINSKY